MSLPILLRLGLIIILSPIVAFAVAALLRLSWVYFSGLGGGTFLGEVFLTYLSFVMGSSAAFILAESILGEQKGGLWASFISLLAFFGLYSIYILIAKQDYEGSRWELIGGAIGAPIGIVTAFFFARNR